MSHVDLATYTENLRVCVLSSTSLSRVELHLRVHFLDPRGFPIELVFPFPKDKYRY